MPWQARTGKSVGSIEPRAVPEKNGSAIPLMTEGLPENGTEQPPHP